jgi:hypothetical protein
MSTKYKYIGEKQEFKTKNLALSGLDYAIRDEDDNIITDEFEKSISTGEENV